MRDIGKNIRDLREQNGLTQEELAGKLFVTRQTVSNYENGRTRPDVDSIMRIADVLNTDANTVFYGLPVPESRKAARRKMLVSSTLLLALLIAAAVLHPFCSALQEKQYSMAPSLLLGLVFDPLLMLVFGWWAMNVFGFTVQPKPLNQPWVKTLRAVILCSLFTYAALISPLLVWLCVTLITSAPGAMVQMNFPYIPIYHEFASLVMAISLRYPVIYALLGGLLWIFGFPKSPKPADAGHHE